VSRPNMDRLGEAWAKALGESAPTLDVDRSRERFVAAHRQFIDRRPQPSWPWILGAAAAVLLVVGAVFALPKLRHAAHAVATVEPGAWIETKPNQTFPLDFSEGSRVVLLSESRVQVSSVDPRGAHLVLLRGALTAKIVHRQDTAWAFAAGPFTVRVTGTKLRVAWQPATQAFEVGVDEGSVFVTGPLLENGRTVAAGQRCAVRVGESELQLSRSPRPASSAELPVFSVTDLRPAPSAQTSGRSDARAPAEASWQELEQRGRYADAIAAAERQGIATIYDTGTAEDLMTLARAARFAGRGDLGAQALLACRRRFPGDARAATAAFLLGRGAPPAQAAQWFNTYLQEQPAGPLAREAAGRLVEAYHQAGNLGAAKEAARRYLAGYPGGPHAAFAQRVLGEPDP
jgi:transmembrane sensor